MLLENSCVACSAHGHHTGCNAALLTGYKREGTLQLGCDSPDKYIHIACPCDSELC
jgi:hypothetical protein